MNTQQPMAVLVSPSRLLGIALLACVVAAVFTAKPLAAWIDDSAAEGTMVQTAADAWLAATQRLGLNQLYDDMHDLVRGAADN